MWVGLRKNKKIKEKEKEKREKKKRERREVSEDLPSNSTTIFECQKPKSERMMINGALRTFLMPEAQPHQTADLPFNSGII